jgi:hypothetical protein
MAFENRVKNMGALALSLAPSSPLGFAEPLGVKTKKQTEKPRTASSSCVLIFRKKSKYICLAQLSVFNWFHWQK